MQKLVKNTFISSIFLLIFFFGLNLFLNLTFANHSKFNPKVGFFNVYESFSDNNLSFSSISNHLFFDLTTKGSFILNNKFFGNFIYQNNELEISMPDMKFTAQLDNNKIKKISIFIDEIKNDNLSFSGVNFSIEPKCDIPPYEIMDFMQSLKLDELKKIKLKIDNIEFKKENFEDFKIEILFGKNIFDRISFGDLEINGIMEFNKTNLSKALYDIKSDDKTIKELEFNVNENINNFMDLFYKFYIPLFIKISSYNLNLGQHLNPYNE